MVAEKRGTGTTDDRSGIVYAREHSFSGRCIHEHCRTKKLIHFLRRSCRRQKVHVCLIAAKMLLRSVQGLPQRDDTAAASIDPALPPPRGGSASRVSPQSCQSHESLCDLRYSPAVLGVTCHNSWLYEALLTFICQY